MSDTRRTELLHDVAAPFDAAAVRVMAAALPTLSLDVPDAELLDQIRALDELESGAAAARARVTARFAARQRAAQAAAGVPAARVGQGVAAQVGLARRMSPHRAGKYVGWATILTTELPETFAALQAGQISEWRAMIVARETLFLSREHRAIVDQELAPRLGQLGDRQTEAEARRIGYRLDPAGFLDRTRRAEADRHVAIRPAPDTMTRLTALLPVAQGVACYAALTRAADTGVSDGDGRGRGAIMADTLVERLTGQATADAIPVEITLLMTEPTLLAIDDADPAAAMDQTGEAGGPRAANEPALLDGYGPIPAPLARQLATPAGDVPAWIRRLYRHPHTGELAAMESRRRCFTLAQRRFIRLRDAGTCRTPYCGAPIRHTDHIHPAEHHGPTSVGNGQGLCEACNYAKQAPGWAFRAIQTGDGKHQVEITTPTGHHYRSRAPNPPSPRRPRNRSAYELAGATRA